MVPTVLRGMRKREEVEELHVWGQNLTRKRLGNVISRNVEEDDKNEEKACLIF